MLNPNWKRVYDKKDWDSWLELEGTTPPFVYEFQFAILYKLLNKYFRTEKGNTLNPETSRKPAQLFIILQKTMDELSIALGEHEMESKRNWEEEQQKNTDPADLILMQDQLREGSMMISIREAANIMLDKDGTQKYEPNSAFDKEELKSGISDEKSEHANPGISSRDNTEIATEIAKEHLKKNPEYSELDEAGLD